ncbi:hypothetical protein BH10PLA2_BH10PLA2_39210 [soil metagenome]
MPPLCSQEERTYSSIGWPNRFAAAARPQGLPSGKLNGVRNKSNGTVGKSDIQTTSVITACRKMKLILRN